MMKKVFATISMTMVMLLLLQAVVCAMGIKAYPPELT